MSERQFRLALQIKELDANIPGAHVVMALADEPDRSTPLLAIEAGGFPSNDVGAAMLADMFEDAASAIREYLSDAAVATARDTDTSALPTVAVESPIVPPRPKFNPRPIGGR